VKLTDAYVRNVKPAYYRQELPDAVLPGMYLIVQPSGARSWAVRYRHEGRPGSRQGEGGSQELLRRRRTIHRSALPASPARVDAPRY
jgi:Arm domain-containing DNA-binding protein